MYDACRNPTDATMFPCMCVTTTLPATGRNTLPIPIGLSTRFSSSWNDRKTRKASMSNDWFSIQQIFLMISANVWYISSEPLPSSFDAKIRFQSSVSNPQSPTLCLYCIFFAFLRQCLQINWMSLLWYTG